MARPCAAVVHGRLVGTALALLKTKGIPNGVKSQFSCQIFARFPELRFKLLIPPLSFWGGLPFEAPRAAWS